MPTEIQDRVYQREALAAWSMRARERVRQSMIVLPTGTGKTVIFMRAVRRARTQGVYVLIFAHRDELLQQAADKLTAVAPELADQIGFVGGDRDEWHMPIVIASVQTISRPNRMKRILDGRGYTDATLEPQPFRLIIVDEAHHTAARSYRYVLDSLGAITDGDFDRDRGGPIILGVTATPQRADSENLGDIYEEIVYARDMPSMMQEGWLCDLVGIQLRLARFKTENLHVRAGEYIASEAGEALENADAPEHIAEGWLKHAVDEDHPRGRKTLVFTPTVRLATQIADAFRERGITAENASEVAGQGMDERRALLRRFAAGEVRVLTNASLLTEGFDEPTVECIVIARPMKSQPLYVQCVGRGTRVAPGKKNCLVIDVVGVTDRHDLIVLAKLFGLDEHARAQERECETCGHGESEHDYQQPCRIAECECERFVPKPAAVQPVGSMLDLLEEEAQQGRIIAKRVDLFRRDQLAWNQASDALWTLPLGDDMVTLRLAGEGRWDVRLLPRYGDEQVLASDLDQGYAMGVAEDYARKHGDGFTKKLVDKNAYWRQKPITDGQANALRKWKYRGDVDGLTAGEASDLLASIIARKRSRA